MDPSAPADAYVDADSLPPLIPRYPKSALSTIDGSKILGEMTSALDLFESCIVKMLPVDL